MHLLSDNSNYIFSNKDLRKIILPLIAEQTLMITVTMADSIMVSSAGEAAISAVSLISNVFVLLINIFVSLTTGGCIIASQYIGKKKIKQAKMVPDQLLLFTTISSIIVMAIIYLIRDFIIYIVFGKLTVDVINNCYIYLYIVAATIPFISIYNSGAAMFRAMGDTKTPMIVSILMNIINLVGNAILVYGFKMSVAGVAFPTLISNIFSAVTIYILLRNPKLLIHFSKKPIFRIDKIILKKILYIGIPNSFENSLFQLGKILVLNMIAGFGTAAIAANSISNTLAYFQILPGVSINIAIVTVCSRCFGAGEFEQVKYYAKKLILISRIFLIITAAAITLTLPLTLNFFNVSDKAKDMAYVVLFCHAIAMVLIWPESFTIPNALRATNDVNFCMIVSGLSMWICRLALSYLMGVTLNLGLFGVWLSMFCDWVIRAIFMIYRFFYSKKSMLYLAKNSLSIKH